MLYHFAHESQYNVVLLQFIVYTDQPKKKVFCVFTPQTKFLKHEMLRRKIGEIFFSPRVFKEKFHENSAKWRWDFPRNVMLIVCEMLRRHLRNIYRETLMNFNYFNVNYSVIWWMVANSELKVSQLIDTSLFSQRFCFDLHLYFLCLMRVRLFDMECKLKTTCHVVKWDLA